MRLKKQLSGGSVPHLLMRGTLSRVQHRVDPLCIGRSTSHDWLYIQLSTGQTCWLYKAMAYTTHIPVMVRAGRLTGKIIHRDISSNTILYCSPQNHPLLSPSPACLPLLINVHLYLFHDPKPAYLKYHIFPPVIGDSRRVSHLLLNPQTERRLFRNGSHQSPDRKSVV